MHLPDVAFFCKEPSVLVSYRDFVAFINACSISGFRNWDLYQNAINSYVKRNPKTLYMYFNIYLWNSELNETVVSRKYVSNFSYYCKVYCLYFVKAPITCMYQTPDIQMRLIFYLPCLSWRRKFVLSTNVLYLTLFK